jgi:hypothetical protein
MIRIVVRHQPEVDADTLQAWFESNRMEILQITLGSAENVRLETRRFVEDVTSYALGVDIFLEPDLSVKPANLKQVWKKISDSLGYTSKTFYVWVSSGGGTYYDGVDLVGHPE